LGRAREWHRANIRSSAGAVYLWKLRCLDHSRLQSKKLNDLSLPLTTANKESSRYTLTSLTVLPLANSIDDDDDKIKSLRVRSSFSLGLDHAGERGDRIAAVLLRRTKSEYGR
jgi:hypothetical protein